MNILIIDDDLSRQNWFAAQFGRFKNVPDFHQAFNDLQALQYMRECKFDLAFFDHDLGVGMTGSDIANEILWNDESYNIPGAVWIQSENPLGAQNIQSKFISYNPKFKVHASGFSSILTGTGMQPGWFEDAVAWLISLDRT